MINRPGQIQDINGNPYYSPLSDPASSNLTMRNHVQPPQKIPLYQRHTFPGHEASFAIVPVPFSRVKHLRVVGQSVHRQSRATIGGFFGPLSPVEVAGLSLHCDPTRSWTMALNVCRSIA